MTESRRSVAREFEHRYDTVHMGYRVEVKEFRQQPDYCGPGALKLALSTFGVEKSEEELAALSSAVAAPEAHRSGGTEHEGMVAAAKALGMHVFTKEESTLGDIEYFIEHEHLPVIVGWFDRDDDHYSVAIELDGDEIILADTSSEGPERRLSRELFPKVWFDFVGEGNHRVSWHWLMVITPEKREFKLEGGQYH